MNKEDLKKLKMSARKQGDTITVTALDAVLGELDVIESRNNKTPSDDQVMSTIKSAISHLQRKRKPMGLLIVAILHTVHFLITTKTVISTSIY